MEGFMTPDFINRQSEGSEEDMIKVWRAAKTGARIGVPIPTLCCLMQLEDCTE